MPDSSTDNGPAVGTGSPGGLGLGERLRSARKARALSLERIAESLHLNESIVLALEEERFDELGAPVFVRGHLKAYAKLVGMTPEAVLDAYREPEPQNPVVPAVERRVRRQVTVNPVLLGFSGLVVLLGIVLALYVMQDDPTDMPATTMPVLSPALTPGADSFAAERFTPDLNEAVESAAARPKPETEPRSPRPTGSVVADPQPVVIAAPAPAEEVARQSGDLVRLSLRFREESWVEISDANRRLLFGLQREGRRRDLAGEPPFRFLIGNAAGVDLSVNDEPYAVPTAGLTGKVARFEISAAAIE